MPTRVERPEAAAAVARLHWTLGGAGLVVAVPIPAEAALDPAYVDAVTEAAIAAARDAGVTGSAWTPFVLDAIRVWTGGRSVEANRALAVNNAAAAARLAAALCPIP